MVRKRSSSRSSPNRNVRLADQIRQDLAQLIQREIPVSRAGLVTLTRVDLTPDYAHAKVYFTVMGAQPAAAAEVLNEKAGWLHSQLFKLLHIHTVPRLHFVHDAGLVHGFHMNELIERANRISGGAPADDDVEGSTDSEPQPEPPDDARG